MTAVLAFILAVGLTLLAWAVIYLDNDNRRR